MGIIKIVTRFVAMKNTCFAILVLLSCLGFCATKLYAQGNFNSANAEDVALSFYKTAQAMPDFAQWAKKTPAFKYQSVTEAPVYIQKERERLLKKWAELGKEDDVLNIRTISPVKVDTVLTEKGIAESYILKILFQNPKETYFPYKHYDDSFAVIVPDLPKFFELPITKEQADLVNSDIQSNRKHEAVINFFIKPYKSYADHPRKINKTDQWVMLGNVVSISISSKKTGAPLWHYGAKWYISPKGKELRDIYNARNTP